MASPTTELPSTLHPFRVLTPEEDEGLLVVGRTRRSGGGVLQSKKQIHDKNNDEQRQKQLSSNIQITHHPSHHHHNNYRSHQLHQSKRSRKSCPETEEPEQVPVLQVSSSSSSSSSCCSTTISHHHSQEKNLHGRISGTTTLREERNQCNKENARRQNPNPSSHQREYRPISNNIRSNSVSPEVQSDTNSKILNLINARNASFLSTTTSSTSSSSNKFSEDELFSDLKSRFIEKHFRTILRSQNSNNNNNNNRVDHHNRPKDYGVFGGNGAVLASVKENCNSNSNVLVGGDGDLDLDLDSSNTKSKDGLKSILKPLKIITVDRPEPQLDLPRVSVLKSSKAKFLKMHDQAKIHVLERYRKLCTTLRTTVWPKLYPLQVLVEVILSNLFVLIVSPFVFIAVILLWLVRQSIGLVLKIRYKGRYRLLSGADAAWAHQAYANDSSFLSLYVIQGDCSISRIRERIMKSVINCQDPQYPGKLTYSRLRCRITEKFGFYCWEALHPMDFCIDDHVRYITNDPSAVLTQDQVLREIQKFIDQPLPSDQPQWQILVVPKFLYSKEHDCYAQEDNLEDDGFGNFDTITVKKKPNNKLYTGNHYYALVWRINHALMDGISAANCLQHCIADMPVKQTIDPLQKLNVSLGMQILMYSKMLIFGSRSLLRSMLYRDLNCFHGPGLTGPKTLAWSRGINLDTVKTIRKKNDGSTITAILASAVGGSLAGLAIRKNNPVPGKIRAGVTCALLPYPNIKPQNRFTVAHLKLRLDLDGSAERLKYATKSAKELVRSADIIKNYGLIRLVGLMPKNAIPWFMENCEATVLISNIPGPKEEYTIFQGQKLIDIIGWNTIKGNTGIGVCLFSYAGRIRAGVIADSAALPSTSDVPNLIEELEKELVCLAKDAELKEKDVFTEAL